MFYLLFLHVCTKPQNSAWISCLIYNTVAFDCYIYHFIIIPSDWSRRQTLEKKSYAVHEEPVSMWPCMKLKHEVWLYREGW